MTDRAAPRTEATAEQQLFDLIEPLMPFTNAEAVRRAVREVIAETRREVAAAPALDVELRHALVGVLHCWDLRVTDPDDVETATLDAARDALRLTPPGDQDPTTPPEGTRLILVQQDLAGFFGTRSERGNRLSFEWGEPDEHGWYSPLITEHVDDLLAGDRDRREAELWEAIDTEIKRLWRIAYEYDQHGEGTIGLLVDMTNAIGGLDSLRALLAAPGQAGPPVEAAAPGAATLAGHRVEGEHDCFLMNCKALGREVAQLREYAASRDIAAAPGAAALDVPECAKCGHPAVNDGIRVFYHADTFACGYSTADRAAPPRTMYGEHLHAHCQRCHYQWKMPVLGARAAEPKPPESHGE